GQALKTAQVRLQRQEAFISACLQASQHILDPSVSHACGNIAAIVECILDMHIPDIRLQQLEGCRVYLAAALHKVGWIEGAGEMRSPTAIHQIKAALGTVTVDVLFLLVEDR